MSAAYPMPAAPGRWAASSQSPARPSVQTPLLIALGIVLSAVPPLHVLGGVGATAALAGVLVAPLLGVYLAPFAVPYQGLSTARVAGINVTVTEGLVLVMLVGWLGAIVARRTSGPPRGSLLGPLVGLLVLLSLTVVRARQLELAGKELLKWLELVVVYLVAISLLTTPARRRLLVGCLVAAPLTQAALAYHQVLFRVGPPHFMVGSLFMRAYGSFEQPNPFGGYVGLAFPVALSLAFARDLRRWRHWLWPATVVLGSVVLLTGSRGAWFGMLVGTLVVLLAGSIDARRALVAGGVLALALLVVSRPLWPPELAERLAVAVMAGVDPSALTTVQVTPENWAVMERLSQWYAGWRMFVDNWWLGVGIGNYNAYYDDYRLPQWPMALGHAHSLYLTLAAEAGLFGLVALVLVAVRAAGLCRGAVARSPDPAGRALSLGLAGGLAAFAAHNLFDVLLVHGVGVLIGLHLALLTTARVGLLVDMTAPSEGQTVPAVAGLRASTGIYAGT